MIGSISESVPLTPWLRRWERTVSLRQDVLSSMYDLDGALGAQQWELAAQACRALLTHAVLLALALRDVHIPAFPRREREWRLGIEAFAGIAPEQAELAWRLYLTSTQVGAEARDHAARVLRFIGRCDGAQEDIALPDVLRSWADSAYAFQELCAALGVPSSTDWYLAGFSAQGDWYGEVLAILEKGEKE